MRSALARANGGLATALPRLYAFLMRMRRCLALLCLCARGTRLRSRCCSRENDVARHRMLPARVEGYLRVWTGYSSRVALIAARVDASFARVVAR